MSHLCEMESAYRAWVERALEEDGANVDGIRGERVAIPLEDANGHTVAEHTAEMRRQREETMALIASISPEDFERRASNALFGSLTSHAVAPLLLPARPHACRPGQRPRAGVQAAVRGRR